MWRGSFWWRWPWLVRELRLTGLTDRRTILVEWASAHFVPVVPAVLVVHGSLREFGQGRADLGGRAARGTAVVPNTLANASNASLSGDGGDGWDGRWTSTGALAGADSGAPIAKKPLLERREASRRAGGGRTPGRAV
jgi:hypothetical protein